MKTCTKCQETKPLDDFYKDPKGPKGHSYYCKQCFRQLKNARYQKNRVEICRKQRIYMQKNKDYYREYKRKYYQANKKRIVQQQSIRQKKLSETAHGRLRLNSRSALNKAVIKGEIKKPEKCSNCLSHGYVEAHHEDYHKPLEVLWLCRSCHGKLHSPYYS